MNRNETVEAIKVMQAWLDGKTIQTSPPGAAWQTFGPLDKPLWNWEEYDYRIKPEPMEIKIWVHPEVGTYFEVGDPPDPKWAGSGWTQKKFREVIE